MQVGPLHEALKPLEWIIGKWTSICAKITHPNQEPIKCCVELECKSIGQPMLIYKLDSWCQDTGVPLHFERGFLCVKPNGKEAAFVVSHCMNTKAYTTIEEGCMNEKQVTFNSKLISSLECSDNSTVVDMQRCLKLNKEGQLEQLLCMATRKTQLSEHMRAVYEKPD